jgi:photosystem II stability/assembly factor-like uncharacterized protein
LAALLPLLLGLAAGTTAPSRAQETPADAEAREQLKARIRERIEVFNQTREERRQQAPSGSKEQATARRTIPPGWINAMAWRSIGPAAMGGRITALAVVEADPSTYYVATASGGLLKTTNNGVTFTHQFDREATVSIGDVCVAPSDPDVVWVGTGEANPRNSVSYGDGVYKSTDGGKSWTNMGLKESFQIGRIAIHPRDPNIVYVGALGRLYGRNDERGLFKTTDGGTTWKKILDIDDKTGVIDLRMHPRDPETLMAATYERRRDEFDVGDPAVKWGPGSGLYKTTDGGTSWTKLTRGLPTVQLGRIGLDYYQKDPDVVFAIVESERIGTGPAPTRPEGAGAAYLGVSGEDREDKAQLTAVTPGGPADRAGLRPGDIVEAIDGQPIRVYEDLVERLRARKPGESAQLRAIRAGQPIELELTLGRRPEGTAPGGDPNRPFAGSLGSQRENVQDRQGPDGFQTGGVYKSTDGGASWTRVNSLNPRPFYFSQVRVDPSDDRYVYVLGIALYRSRDGGATFRDDGGRGVHADGHALWIDPRDGRHMIVGGDGGFYATYDRMETWDHLNHLAIGQFYDVALDANRLYRAYGGLQDNGTWGGPSAARTEPGPINEDWIRVGGGDGFTTRVDPEDADQIYFTSQYGAMGRRNLRTGEVAAIRPRPEPGRRLRWNWKTPFLLSPHNPRIVTCAGNYVYRSLDRGDDPRRISPEITRTDKGSATALAESPKDPQVLYAGTDDGWLWVTRDGGHQWTNLTETIGLSGPRYVATIEASRFEAGRAYVAFDGHRSDDDRPLLYATEDFGQTWRCLSAELPRGSTRCLREDPKNPDLLFAGTEFGLWVSVDRGRSWAALKANLPTVAVHEVAIHPAAGELVAATHGRSLWVLDVAALEQMTPEVLAAGAHLFEPVPAVRWWPEPTRGGTNRRFVGQGPPRGAQLVYSLRDGAERVTLRIRDYTGDTIRDLRPGSAAGLHRVAWDLTANPAPPRPREGPGGPSRAAPPRSPGRPGSVRSGPPVPPGTYRVVLTVDGREFSRALRVDADPEYPISATAVDATDLERFHLEGSAEEAEEEGEGPDGN